MTELCKYNAFREEPLTSVWCTSPEVLKELKKEFSSSGYWKNKVGPFMGVQKGKETIKAVYFDYGVCTICKHYEK